MTNPSGNFPCDCRDRTFPPEWKDYWFRQEARIEEDGIYCIYCPLCRFRFDHSTLKFLTADHIWPYSLFGETVWENYQLLCISCNSRKKDKIDTEIRDILGHGEFRNILQHFVQEKDPHLAGFLGPDRQQ